MKITDLFPELFSTYTRISSKDPSTTKKGSGRFHKSGYSIGSKRQRKMRRTTGTPSLVA